MVLIVDQGMTSAYNIVASQVIRVQDNHILLEQGGAMRVIGRYKTSEEAEEVFREMLDDLADMDGLPFSEAIKPYYLP